MKAPLTGTVAGDHAGISDRRILERQIFSPAPVSGVRSYYISLPMSSPMTFY